MNRIIECVANFSEGRETAVIDAICAEIKKVPGVLLLDVDPGKDTNRTVVTFAGSPEEVGEAAFQAMKKAAELIDMSRHHGAHPRLGATDVCPFVPVSGVTMADCVELAGKLGQRVGDELGIPVYLYEEAARDERRRSLAYIREGEYEALPKKLQSDEFKPDFGPRTFNPGSGATVIGAREFLIAYNVNLNTRDVKIARKIASRLREQGRLVTDPESGEKKRIPGALKAVRAVGWYIDEYNMAQVSVNLLNYRITPLYRVFTEADRIAREFGARVTGSELVGLIPLAALSECGRYFLQQQGASTAVSEKELLRVAVQSLGLTEIGEFDPEHKVIEYRFRPPAPLVQMKLTDFCAEVASSSPAPGGGSVAALAGSLASGLSAMVGNLTYGKKGYEEAAEEILQAAEKAMELQAFFTAAIDQDTAAFNRLMDAFALPKGNEDESQVRRLAIEEATRYAALVPFGVLEKTPAAAEVALLMARKGNRNSLSDAGVAGLAVAACAEGALYNVLINLQDLEDKEFCTDLSTRAREHLQAVNSTCAEIREVLFSELGI